MHVVVTGFDARAARPGPGHARHSLAFLITEILEHCGHKVTQTTDWLDELETAAIYEGADRILVGLASPLALTSTYAYSAMRVMNEYWEDPRLRLFVDDPDTGKIVHGATSALRREAKSDPLFANRSFHSRPFFGEARESRTTRSMPPASDWAGRVTGRRPTFPFRPAGPACAPPRSGGRLTTPGAWIPPTS